MSLGLLVIWGHGMCYAFETARHINSKSDTDFALSIDISTHSSENLFHSYPFYLLWKVHNVIILPYAHMA